MHHARQEYFLAAIADRFAGAADDIVQVITGALRMQTDTAADMNGRRDDAILSIVIHPDRHTAGSFIHARNRHGWYVVKINGHAGDLPSIGIILADTSMIAHFVIPVKNGTQPSAGHAVVLVGISKQNRTAF